MRECEVRQGLLEAQDYEQRQHGEPLEEGYGPMWKHVDTFMHNLKMSLSDAQGGASDNIRSSGKSEAIRMANLIVAELKKK